MQTPSYPDPNKTAKAQANLNKNTAITQTELNQTNQVTPTGSLTYKQIGKNKDGTPRYQATTALAAPQQALLDQQNAANANIGQLAVTKSGQLQSELADPVTGLALPSSGGIQKSIGDFSTDRTAIEDALRQRINPQLDRQEVSLRTRLAGQGIKEGTEAWNNAYDAYGRQRNDADLAITGQGLAEQQGQQQLALGAGNFANSAQAQQFGEDNTNLQSKVGLRNQALSEYGNLTGAAPVQYPNFQQTPQSGVSPVDYTGQVGQQFQAQNTAAQNTNSAIGNIAGTVGGWLFSDERLKTDMHATGMKTPDGIPMKTFRYKGSPMLQMGVTAQDAQKKRPDAVAMTQTGYKAVNYDKIGSPMLRMGAR